MKKILLSVALVAMSVFSMSALSIKLEVNDVEVKNGDVIEITTLDNVLYGIEGMGQSMAPHMKMTNEGSAKTNADALIGATGRVTQDIDNDLSQGQVKLSGMEWSARSTQGDKIPTDTMIRVDRIEGVKVFVSKN